MKRNSISEWKSYLVIFNKGASRSELIKAASSMRCAVNKKAALLNLGFTTAKDRKAIKARWNAINSTTDAEAALHCQFEGLPAL